LIVRAAAASIGVDVGGTKLEAIVLDAEGREHWRRRWAAGCRNWAGCTATCRACGAHTCFQAA